MSIRVTSAEDWQTDVLEAPGAVLVDFWAEWCGPCRVMEPLLEKLQQAHEHDLSVVKLDVQDHPDVAARYGVLNLPTLIVFRHGEAVEHLAGHMPLSVLERKMQPYL